MKNRIIQITPEIEKEIAEMLQAFSDLQSTKRSSDESKRLSRRLKFRDKFAPSLERLFAFLDRACANYREQLAKLNARLADAQKGKADPVQRIEMRKAIEREIARLNLTGQRLDEELKPLTRFLDGLLPHFQQIEEDRLAAEEKAKFLQTFKHKHDGESAWVRTSVAHKAAERMRNLRAALNKLADTLDRSNSDEPLFLNWEDVGPMVAHICNDRGDTPARSDKSAATDKELSESAAAAGR